MQFRKHYSREEARALLPQVQRWLKRLAKLTAQLLKQDRQIELLLKNRGDTGGPEVNAWVETMAGIRAVVSEFYRREVQIKDLQRGLIDFPAIIDGKEVFLCWENGEEDVNFWHGLEAGYAGRQPLED